MVKIVGIATFLVNIEKSRKEEKTYKTLNGKKRVQKSVLYAILPVKEGSFLSLRVIWISISGLLAAQIPIPGVL